MVVVPGLVHVASVAELETQEVELALEVALLAVAAGTQERVGVGVLPLELARSSCAPWRSSLPK